MSPCAIFIAASLGRIGRRLISIGLLIMICTAAAAVQGQQAARLPEPLGVTDVITYASKHRREIMAASAAARAAKQRGRVVSALDDPMVMPSIDHLPFMLHGVDASLMVEQRFYLSNVLDQRRRVADATARGQLARVEVVAQDVKWEAARAFFMLRQRRMLVPVLAQQLALAKEFVVAASVRYGSGTGSQSDLLRAEVEVARLEGTTRALEATVAAAEAMLNASLGRRVDAPVPELRDVEWQQPRTWGEVRKSALALRAELDVGRAEIARADAETEVMRSMSRPMGFVRTGPSYTMSDRWGWMLMLGVSIPLWQDKYDAGISEATAMGEMARADLSAMQLMIEGDAASARLEMVAAQRRVAALVDDVLPRARQAVAPALSAYATGTTPLVSVLDAAQTLWSLESELVAAEAELGMRWVELMRAQGRFDVEGYK